MDPSVPGEASTLALAQVVHELRTPLMAMGMTAELLSEDLDHLERPQVQQLVATLHRSTLWLHQMVENLHEFAALGRERSAREYTPVDLRAVLEEAARVVTPLLAARGQRLEVLAPAALPPVPAVRPQLGQVYLNLLGNASKFASPNTAIRVVLGCTAVGVRVAVEDRGPGIPAAAATRLFDLFYQAVPPTVPAQPGVGLGLAIVKEIVEAHGGRVGAENRRGGGARFWFEVPLRQAPASVPVPGLQ